MLNKPISLIAILSVLCQVTLCNPIPDPGTGSKIVTKITDDVLESEKFNQLLSSCGHFILNNTKDALSYLKEHQDEILEKAKHYGTVFAEDVKNLFNNSLDKVVNKIKNWKEKSLNALKNAKNYVTVTGKKVLDKTKEYKNKAGNYFIKKFKSFKELLTGKDKQTEVGFE